jgi:translation initiation factor 2B subunit (eIF-2B alpha/beta/delta family)
MKKNFNKIIRDIKNIKIQGATNIAKATLKAYSLFPTENSKKKLLSLRPTEPMIEKVLNFADKNSPKKILKHFDEVQKKINSYVLKLIKKQEVIFTHCHSTNVVRALINAKIKGKDFEVYNTETRPLFQGRKTAKELRNAGIKITMFVDSAMGVAISKEQGTKKVDKIFLGADALLKKGIINKIGSETIAKLAKQEKIPVYIIADSWKFTKKKVPREQRKLNEVWDNAPKKIKIKNPAFEFVKKKYITGIVTEFGIMKYKEFLKNIKKVSNKII